MHPIGDGSPAIAGVKGGSPRPSLARLNADYLAERNAALALKRRSAEIDLAIRQGTLLPAGALKIELGFLISAAREAVRAWHVRLPPLLLGKDLHEIGQILREAEGELLNILADLPAALGNGALPLEESGRDVTSLAPPTPQDIGAAKKAERVRAGRERWNAIRRERRAAAKRGET